MRAIYQSTLVQLGLCILYPVVMFVVLSHWNSLTWQPIVVGLVFCSTWRNIRFVLLSTAVLCLTTVPLWWSYVAPRIPHLHESIVNFYPLVMVNFLVILIILPSLVVGIRNAIIARTSVKA